MLRPSPVVPAPAAAVPEPVAAAPVSARAREVRLAPKPPVHQVPVGPLEDAREALAGGEHGRALELAGAAWGPEAIRIKGLAMANLGQGQAALALVEEGLERHPMDARLHYLHSLLASELGRDGEALRALDRTLYLAPEHVAALMDRARARGAQGRFREGARDLTQALASLAGTAANDPVDGLEPHRAGTVRERCVELLEQFQRRAGA